MRQNCKLESQAIIVGRPARLKCNYVKYRTESVRHINWFVGYDTISLKIFDFAVTTGRKESPPLAFITVDEASATEDELTITLTEFREAGRSTDYKLGPFLLTFLEQEYQKNVVAMLFFQTKKSRC